MMKEDTQKPEFIELDGGMMFRPPFLQSDAFLAGWLIPSDTKSQQALLDRTVNRALEARNSSVRYESVVPVVMLAFADIQRVTSQDHVHKDFGYVIERDATIWCLARVRDGDSLDRWVWYLPYIWVDDPIALIAGREVFGFPKQLAQMTIPKDQHSEGPFVVRSPVLATHRSDTLAEPKRLFGVQSTALESVDASAAAVDFGPGGLDKLLDAHQGGAALEGAFSSAGRLLANLVKNLRERTLPMLFLKQFPDACVPGRACYQSVIEAPARVTRLDGVGLLHGRWTADFANFASHRLRETLGIAEGPLSIGKGLWVKYSFSVDPAQEV